MNELMWRGSLFLKTGMLGWLITLLLFHSTSQADWRVQLLRNAEGQAQILQVHPSVDLGPSKILRSTPELRGEWGQTLPGSGHFEEISYPDDALPADCRSALKKMEVHWIGSEVRTIVNQGPSGNRINLVFVGDGYTENQKDQYFADVNRMVQDLFQGSTFASYLPLFNVSAVFVPSKESGLSDRQKRNTALGLYRTPQGSKRAILPGNRTAIERALKLAGVPADFPILIANDDFYGGLGGRYAISTRSETSGSMVLRHELGHNFGKVGEEYDGGSVYSGANASRSTNVPWTEWLASPVEGHAKKFLGGHYDWHNLNIRPHLSRFHFPGTEYRLLVRVSTVGWSKPGEVSIFLDDQEIAYQGNFTPDRSFFTIRVNTPLSRGRHELKIVANQTRTEHTLAYAQIYAIPKSYDETPGKVDAFLSFNHQGEPVAYRPTDNACLMRDMKLKKFCPVCAQNMWHQFLGRIRLIDELLIDQSSNQVRVLTPHLQGLSVRWFRDGKELPQWEDQKMALLDQLGSGDFTVRVALRTSEVRRSTSDFTDETHFKISYHE